MPILQIRSKEGNFIPINSIKGDKGKSAYEQAKEGGYKGSEKEFIAVLNGLTFSEEITRAMSEIEQLRADIEFFENVLQVEQQLYEKAKKYYPRLWSAERIKYLYELGMLTEEEYKSIVGVVNDDN